VVTTTDTPDFLPQASRIFNEWAKLPCTFDEFNIKVKVHQAKYFPTCSPLPGVPELLEGLTSANPTIHIALASSSNAQNFALKTSHLQHIFKHFPAERRLLGDDPRIPAGKGKPAPDIYLLALKSINDILAAEGKEEPIKPEECLVLEDAVPGVEAGRRAGMQVVWCPHPGLLDECKDNQKEVLAGLTGGSKESDVNHVPNARARFDDGYATLLHSLEDFPYAKFGINGTHR